MIGLLLFVAGVSVGMLLGDDMRWHDPLVLGALVGSAWLLVRHTRRFPWARS
jgi:hypothetical protein